VSASTSTQQAEKLRRKARFDVLRALAGRDARNFAALITAQIVVGFIGLASTRYLTPQDKGLFTGVYLWSLVGQSLVSLSLPNALLYFGASQGRSRPSTPLTLLLGTTAVLCGAGLAVYVGSHAPGHVAIQWLLVPLPAGMLAFEVATYSALAEGGRFYAYRLTQAVLFACLGVPALLIAHSATLLTLALLTSYVVTVGLRGFRFTSVQKNLQLEVIDLLRWSLRAHAGLTLSLLATRLDLLFVTLFLNTFAAGQYAAASALPNMLAFSGNALGLSLARRATADAANGMPTFAARWAFALVTLGGLMAAVLIAVRTPLITNLFGQAYLPAAPILIPLAVALPFWALAAYQSQILAAIGRPFDQTVGQGIAALLLGVGSAYGVVHNDVQIVAWSNVVAYVCSVAWQSLALAMSRNK
jgi:O-antigen/teichoic acid export membrane protein